MVLQSQLFRGDSKLEAAAVSDPAHIVPGANGPHVAKIQQALIQLDGAAISQDGAYGNGTAAAVRAFKQQRQILNFQGKIDDIVGKKTIAALDGGMLAKERGGGVGNGSRGRLGVNTVSDAPPLLQSLSPLVVQLFNEAPNSFILAKSVDSPNGPKGNKNDLDTSPIPTPPLTRAERFAISNYETRQPLAGQFLPGARLTPLNRFEKDARGEALDSNQADGVNLMDRFFRNNDPNLRVVFDVGTSISNRVRDSNGFATEHNGVNSDINNALQAQFLTGTIDYRKMQGKSPPPRPKPGVTHGNLNGVIEPPEVAFGLSEPRMVALIGSFQACTLILKSFEVDKQLFTYRATLRYELLDHFGVDNSDVLFDGLGHGTDGQIAFWLLQHTFRPGHIPYRYVVIVEKGITGTLLDPKLFPDLNLQELLKGAFRL